MGNMFETLSLDGPGIILEFRDPEEYIRGTLQIKERDEISVSFGDPWNNGSVNKSEDFTVLTCKPSGKGLVKLSCLAKPVYKMKIMASKAKIWQKQSVEAVLRDNANGASVDCGGRRFAIAEDYHLLPGTRPSHLLRQFAEEHGAHIWYNRGTLHMKKFADMWAALPKAVYHWGTFSEPNHIFKYKVPSEQIRAEEKNARTFTGWDEVKDRITLPLNLPFLKKAKSKPVKTTSFVNPYILGNEVVGKKTVIDFLGIGRMSIVPGDVLALKWHTGQPGNPIDEGLPRRVVVDTISHWYSAQKYYIRVKGVVALEPSE